MTEERKCLLNSIGFVWNADAQWMEWIVRTRTTIIVAYEKDHKNTKVPKRYKKDEQLGHWVSRQRDAYKKKKTREDRRRLFDSIDF